MPEMKIGTMKDKTASKCHKFFPLEPGMFLTKMFVHA